MRRIINLTLSIPILFGLVYLVQNREWIGLAAYFSIGIIVVLFDAKQGVVKTVANSHEDRARLWVMGFTTGILIAIGYVAVMVLWPIKLVWIIKRKGKNIELKQDNG